MSCNNYGRGITKQRAIVSELREIDGESAQIEAQLAEDERQRQIDESIEAELDQEAHQRKVNEAWAYICEHRITPQEWLRRFKDRVIHRELVDLYEMKTDFDDDMDFWDDWSGPAMPMSTIHNF